jgi:two-component sensor histidine kinase
MCKLNFNWFKYFIALYVLFFCGLEFSFSQGIFKHYDRSNGLLSNKIYGILQDSMGFIWLNSENGIQQFDGSNFINFQTSDGLSTNDIPFMRNDPSNRIWAVGFDKSLQIIENGTVKRLQTLNTIYFGTNILFIDSFIYVIDGFDIWIYSTDLSHCKKLLIPKSKIAGPGIAMSWVDELNQICFALEGQIYKLQNNNMAKSEMPFVPQLLGYMPRIVPKYGTVFLEKNRISAFKNDSVHTLYQSSFNRFEEPRLMFNANDNCYFVNLNQLFKLDFKSEPRAVFKANGNITGILIDRGSNIWLSTYYGVYKIDNKFASFEKLHAFEQDHGFNLMHLDTLNNQFFLGDHNSGIVLLKNGKKYVVETNFRKSYNEIKKIEQIGNHTFLIGNDEGLFQFVQSSTLPEKFSINRVIKGNIKDFYYSKDEIYCSSGIEGLKVIRNNKIYRIYNSRTYALCYNQTKGIIFSSANGLKWLLKDSIYSFKSSYLKSNSFKKIESINANKVLLLSNSSQLSILELTTEKIKTFAINQSVSPIEIYDWHLQSDKTILLNTNVGLLKTSLDKIENDLLFENLTEKSVQPVFILGKHAFFIAEKTLYKTNLNKAIVAHLPEIGIYVIDNKSYVPVVNNHLRLDYQKSAISLAIIDKKYGNTKYFYRLLGFSKTWIPLRNDRIDFVNLHPETYVLEIKGLLANGKWHQLNAVEIDIIPRLIDRVWFRLVILFFVLAIIGFIFKTIIDNFRNKSKYARAQINALSLQMNPHFITNSITSIQHLILNKKNAMLSVEYLNRFSDLSIAILNSSEINFIMVRDEIALLENYLELEKLRFNGKFQGIIQVEDGAFDIDSYTVPPMFLQPIVENAIKHGIRNKKELGSVIIRFIPKENEIEVIIEDNGAGINLSKINTTKSRRKSITYSNLYERISLYDKLYDYKIKVVIMFKDEVNRSGTVVKFSFPKHFKHKSTQIDESFNY